MIERLGYIIIKFDLVYDEWQFYCNSFAPSHISNSMNRQFAGYRGLDRLKIDKIIYKNKIVIGLMLINPVLHFISVKTVFSLSRISSEGSALKKRNLGFSFHTKALRALYKGFRVNTKGTLASKEKLRLLII